MRWRSTGIAAFLMSSMAVWMPMTAVPQRTALSRRKVEEELR